jgi:hypothetical protein
MTKATDVTVTENGFTVPAYLCPLCGGVCAGKEALVAHLRDDHPIGAVIGFVLRQPVVRAGAALVAVGAALALRRRRRRRSIG